MEGRAAVFVSGNRAGPTAAVNLQQQLFYYTKQSSPVSVIEEVDGTRDI